MSAGHTPGPWTLVGDMAEMNLDVISASGCIAMMECVNDEVDDDALLANARLIAAAPDLARALADLLADAVEMGLDDSPVSGSLIEARKALAKAEAVA